MFNKWLRYVQKCVRGFMAVISVRFKVEIDRIDTG